MHVKIFHAAQGVATSIVQELSNKQSAEVICRFDRLRTACSMQETVKPLKRLSSTHAFNYIASAQG